MEVIRVPSPQPIRRLVSWVQSVRLASCSPLFRVQTFQTCQPGQEGKIVVRVALVNGQFLQILHLTDVFNIFCRQLHLPQAEVSVV